MARRANPPPADRPTALRLAERLRAALAGDTEFAIDDLPAQTPGVREPGAMFHVQTAAGRRYRIRVIRD